MNNETRNQFDVLYAKILTGKTHAWEHFSALCREYEIDRTQLLDELTFDQVASSQCQGGRLTYLVQLHGDEVIDCYVEQGEPQDVLHFARLNFNNCPRASHLTITDRPVTMLLYSESKHEGVTVNRMLSRRQSRLAEFQARGEGICP